MKKDSSIANMYISVFIAVDVRGSKCGVSACHHCGVVPDDEDAQPLAQVSHHLVLVLPQVPGQLPPQLDDSGQANLVPAAEGVDSKWEEGDCLSVAPLLILPQLGLVCMLHCTVPLLWGSCHQSLLEGVDHGDVEGGIASLGPDGDQDVRRPVVGAREVALCCLDIKRVWCFHNISHNSCQNSQKNTTYLTKSLVLVWLSSEIPVWDEKYGRLHKEILGLWMSKVRFWRFNQRLLVTETALVNAKSKKVCKQKIQMAKISCFSLF